MRQRLGRGRFLCALLMTAVLMGPLPGDCSELLLPRSAEPVVLLDNRDVAGCGFEARYEAGQESVKIGVLLMKENAATVFEISGTWISESGAPRSIDDFSLRSTGLDTRTLFPPLQQTADGRASTRKSLPGFEGTEFIRNLMVGGATITLMSKAGARLDLTLPGPLSQSIRASYLNCAGDLIRPAEEH